MKVFVTGASGQLGKDMMAELNSRGLETVGSDIILNDCFELCQDFSSTLAIPLDITDEEAVRETLLRVRPDAVIHCAAWTAVDAAEEPGNREKAYAINVSATRNIAEMCKFLDCKMLYVSSDYVFNGSGKTPWEPDSKAFGPLNVYGKTKLEGEFAVEETLEKFMIVRTSWAFGTHGNNFAKTILHLSEKQESISVVDDQIGTPTYTADLARLLADMIVTDKYGFYHATNEGGYISWCDFAREIIQQAGRDTLIVPVLTAERPSKAARPLNSRLNKSKLPQMGFQPLPDWKDALARYLEHFKDSVSE